MRQLTHHDAPTGPQRPPDETPAAPLTARERPRTQRSRRRLLRLVVASALVAASITAVFVARGGENPLTGDEPAPDPAQAARLAAAALPAGEAFEPELSAYVGESGARIQTGFSPAATSLACDVTADPPLAAERDRIAVATAGYRSAPATGPAVGRRPEQLALSAVVLAGPRAGQVLDDVAAAVPGCAANPLGSLHDVRTGSLPNVDGVVFRAHGAGRPGDGPDQAVTCVLVTGDSAGGRTTVLRSCGHSDDAARADGLAVRGIGQLRVRLERALGLPELPGVPAEVRAPTWALTPVVTVRRNADVSGCALLTEAQVVAASGQPVLRFDRSGCRWELAGGTITIGTGAFGTGLSTGTPTVLRGNSAVFTQPADGECSYRVATNSTASLRIGVSLTVSDPAPCALARQLLGTAFDRLPPA